MTDREIVLLKFALTRGNLYWRDEDRIHKVVGIYKHPEEIDECAHLTGPGGKYCALSNCELSDFVLVSPVPVEPT